MGLVYWYFQLFYEYFYKYFDGYFYNIQYINIMPIKIAFLFLTMADVNFPKFWETYFKNQDPHSYSIYCHPKYPEKVTINWMKSNIIKNLVSTEWGHLTNAYIALLKAALEDKLNTHFIFVSESCIPIKSFKKLDSFLSDHQMDASYIYLNEFNGYNFDKSALPKNYLKDITLIKHSGWFCLSRYHAEKLVNNPNVYKFNRVIAGDEHILSLIYKPNDPLFINFLITYANWNYSREIVNEINIKLRALYEHQEKTGESKKDEIFELRKLKSKAGKHPKTYFQIGESTIKKIKSSESFFFRKFDKTSNIGNYVDEILK